MSAPTLRALKHTRRPSATDPVVAMMRADPIHADAMNFLAAGLKAAMTSADFWERLTRMSEAVLVFSMLDAAGQDTFLDMMRGYANQRGIKLPLNGGAL
jgi:hypothetical protein